MKTEHALLDIAGQDLKAAKCLFEEKLYSQAIFYLQQAVEKATKSMGLYHNVISEDELENIGHESVEIYIKVTAELKNKVKMFHERIKKFPKLKHTTLFKKYEDLDSDKLNEILDNFESYLKHPNRQISDEKLEKILSELTKLETEIENQKITIKKEEIESLKSFFREVADVISEKYPALREASEKELKKFDSLPPESIEAFVTSLGIPQAICNYSLIFLSTIFGPHAISSRYPYPKHVHNPLMVYTREHPLVKRFDQLANITKGVLDRMSKLFSQDFSQKLGSWSGQGGG